VGRHADTQPVKRVLAAALSLAAVALVPVSAGATPVPQAPACPMFPANSFWHADVSKLPLHPKSSTWVGSMGGTSSLHPDFGTVWDGAPNGIPYNVVPGTQARVGVTFTYAGESDPGPYPIPPKPAIEGGANGTGDRHVLIVDKDACKLYELYSAYPNSNGTWRAGSGAVFDLKSNALRPDTWTSADAGGLAMLPGLVRYEEVAAGRIDHAIRVSANATDARHLWPARHDAGAANANLPPMGLRMRLKASVDISGFSSADQVILKALKTYGMIVADNGSSWFISGAPDSRWNDDDLHNLTRLHGSDFEAVDESSLMVAPNSGAVKASVRVTRPNGGESWARGSTQSLKWSFAGSPGTSVRINLLRNGTTVSTVAASAPLGSGGLGAFSWKVPTTLAAGAGYKIKVTVLNSSPAVVDLSDAAFTLT
jgi:Ser-Thr-rich glycosyl-phosphatidyl-inositol-anchored membrane family protein